MARIYVCYRRDDSRSFAERIYDRLVDAFGQRNVFEDVAVISPGVNFAEEIRQYKRLCDVKNTLKSVRERAFAVIMSVC